MKNTQAGNRVKFDYEALRKLIKFKFGSIRQFAEELGMRYATLLSRLDGETYFSPDEIKACKAKLEVSDKDMNHLFCRTLNDPFAA